MNKYTLAIVGIGKGQSVGFNLGRRICQEPILNSLDALLFNNRDTEPPYSEKDEENLEKNAEFVKLLTTKAQAEKGKEPPAKYARLSIIAKEADMIFLCYENRFGATNTIPSWEHDFRKNLYPGNLQSTEDIADVLKERGAKGQIIVVTNPSLMIANTLQHRAELDDGQVLAFNPDTVRLEKELNDLRKKYPTLQPHHIQQALMLGDHGEHSALYLPKIKSIQGHELPSADELLQIVKSKGAAIANMFASTGATVADDISEFILSSINGQGRFVWGIPCEFEECKMFCSVPVVNRMTEIQIGDKQTKKVFRAKPEDEFEKNFEKKYDSKSFRAARIKLKQEQTNPPLTVKQSKAVVYDLPNNEINISDYHVDGYETIKPKCPLRIFHAHENEIMGIAEDGRLMRGKLEDKLMEDGVTTSNRGYCRTFARDEHNFYLGWIENGKGRISVYDDSLELVKEKDLDFGVRAMASNGNLLYLADTENRVHVIDKKDLDGEIIKCSIPDGAQINSITPLGGTNFALRVQKRNHGPGDDSHIHIVMNGKTYSKTVRESAFDATVHKATGEQLFFFGGDDVSVTDSKLTPMSSHQLPEIQALRFDTDRNCLYATTQTDLSMMPYFGRKFLAKNIRTVRIGQYLHPEIEVIAA